jgi:xylose isomerase
LAGTFTSWRFRNGGVNFDAKIRRNSIDPEDLFISHISGMDVFAKGLLAASDILENSDYKKLRTDRYASFDNGKGKAFEEGTLTLEDLQRIAHEIGEPQPKSGKQELFEAIVNMYI